jgi:PAS domain S-box-containing protein
MIAIIDNFPENIYITDPETYEILFINSEFQKQLGRDVTGKICYEEFQGLDEPCSFCTNEKLSANPGSKCVWEHYNPVLDRHYTISDRLIDWPDGRKVRFEVAVDISGQKKAENELREEKAFVDSSIDSLPGIFFVLDGSGRFQRWNRMLEDVTGFSSAEIRGKGLSDLTEDNDREKIRRGIEDAGKKRTDIEVKLVTKRGRRIPHLLNIKHLDGLGNNLLVGFGLDTTELKLVERELHRSELRFRNLVEHSPVPVVFYNLGGELEHINGIFTKRFGYGPQDISTLNSLWGNLFPDEGYRNYAVSRCNSTMKDSGDECECCIAASDGSEKIVDVRGISIESGTIFTFVDITKRKQYENELKDHQRQLKLALDAQQAGTWVWDISGDTIDLDQRSMEIFGGQGTGESLRMEDFKKIVHVKNRDDFERFFSYAPADVDEHDLVIQLAEDEGSVRHVRLQSLTVRDGRGEPLSMVGICLDVSMEVKDRKRLKSALSKLKVSNRELEQFAYIASHDLQEPLRMVGSYLQLIERRYSDKLDDDGHEFINYAVDGAYRMKEMINDLLSFSRVQTRGKELRPVSSVGAVEKAVTYLSPVIEERGAVVDFDGLPVVQADEDQLVNLFQNLIGNGIKFNNSDIPTVKIDALKQGNLYEFSVRDNGIGIDREYFEKVFVIFERLHGVGDYEGSGIGMAICKRTVERHGGRIWLDSEIGKGTTIKFTLPAEGVRVEEIEQGGAE